MPWNLLVLQFMTLQKWKTEQRKEKRGEKRRKNGRYGYWCQELLVKKKWIANSVERQIWGLFFFLRKFAFIIFLIFWSYFISEFYLVVSFYLLIFISLFTPYYSFAFFPPHTLSKFSVCPVVFLKYFCVSVILWYFPSLTTLYQPSDCFSPR